MLLVKLHLGQVRRRKSRRLLAALARLLGCSRVPAAEKQDLGALGLQTVGVMEAVDYRHVRLQLPVNFTEWWNGGS
jgi:hypothetical protein